MSATSIRQLFQGATVSATAAEFGLTARALRYYEERGLIEVARDRLNARHFGPGARARLQWIKRLRSAGVTIKDIREVLEREDKGTLRLDCALDKLEHRRLKVLEMLDVIDSLAAEINAASASIAAAARG